MYGIGRLLGTLRWGVRWGTLIPALLVAYCLPAGCLALLVTQLPAPSPTPASPLTETPPLTAPPSRTPAPTASATTEAAGRDYRESMALRRVLCQRLRISPDDAAHETLCQVRLPLEANTAAPILRYLRAVFTPGETIRAGVSELLGAYGAGDDEYLLPVRVQGGERVDVRLHFTFDTEGVYQAFEVGGAP